LKQFDKPHEDSVEWFLRNDKRIMRFIGDVGINIDVVIAIIHRTAYPFRDKIAENAKKRMQELFSLAGISEYDTTTKEHYEYLGWLLSVSERIAGYALGDFEDAKELARRNAHALGWHPSRINEESVKYFSILKEEKEMVRFVLDHVPEKYKKNLFDNIAAFKKAWEEENSIRNSIRRKELSLVLIIEKNEVSLDPFIRRSVLNIYRELPLPVPPI
jgi:hypothetical protein